jgi:DNA polymerase III epsilon subunit family exonuclease
MKPGLAWSQNTDTRRSYLTLETTDMLAVADIAGLDRCVAIDLETTGHPAKTHAEVLKLPKGLRLPGCVIQIGCIELLRDGDSWKTGATWETLVNPEGSVHPAAAKVHGIHPNAIKAAPRFVEVYPALAAFLGSVPLLAHAAWNEIDYLNFEMRRAKLVGWDETPFWDDRFLDTQIIARGIFPGAPGSLDVLLDRLWIDRSGRDQHHGALLDAELTAEAFIKMTNGFVQDEIRTLSP